MAFKLPKFDRNISIVTETFKPTLVFHQWWDKVIKQLEVILNQLAASIIAIEAALAAADIALDAAAAAQTAADSAQTAADDAQAAVDAIVIPPSGVRNVSANTALNPDDVTILVDTTSGTITISLSNASGYTVPVVITKTTGANPVNVVPTGADNLNGGAGPVSLTSTGETKTFSADQVSEWWG